MKLCNTIFDLPNNSRNSNLQIFRNILLIKKSSRCYSFMWSVKSLCHRKTDCQKILQQKKTEKNG